MKRLVFSMFILGLSNFLNGQDNLWHVDQKALHIPVSNTSSTDDLARYFQSNFNGETEKIRAIYTWVAHHIDYDKDSILYFNTEKDPTLKITAAMRRRKGVCENFAAIFQDIASKSGITTVVIPGYTKQGGNINKVGHNWCAAQIEGEWFLFDPTWDEDFYKEAHYFKVDPQIFIESHMPFDPLWQLLETPYSHREFVNGNRNSRTRKENYKDSVSAYFKLNTLAQYESTIRRMKVAGQMNELTDHHYRFVQMQIGIIYENENMKLYNAAVADLNKANMVFNNFVRYRNNGFAPAIPDEDLLKMLLPIDSLVNKAIQQIDQIGVAYPDYQYEPGLIRNRLQNLQQRLQDQQIFLNRFVATPPKERGILFYK